ncbi:MAG: pilus assembly PilX N-terminal domain-containing protein [bacterium]|nr:pilus assembly PilX N-terminal domain-containing protein [bacterium]
MKKNKIGKHSGKNKGFTLLFAVLVGSLMLSIGIAILNISLKEMELSVAGRESQFAFYAADTGAECALFWDRGEKIFATSTHTYQPDLSHVTCNGQAFTSGWTVAPKTDTYAKTEFTVYVDPSDKTKGCAVVQVEKDDSNNDGLSATVIRAKGRNNCETGGKTKIERGIKVTY